MASITTWLPIVLGGLVIVVVCYKVFTDNTVSNYLGYALLLAAFLCALPTLQNLDYKGQFGELNANMKSTVAGQSANLGGDIDVLNKKLDLVIKKMNAGSDVPVVLNADYQRNKASEVLVFFSDTARDQAGTIRSYLLDSGYKSSSTYTDFAELVPPLPSPGSVRLVYPNSSVNLANDVRAALRTRFPALKEIGDKVVDKLNSGDLQVQLF
jgi:hypothetical protein